MRSPERSFFSKIPLFFVAEGEELPTEREQNCVAKAGKAAAETERSERKAEGGDRRETTEPRASERSERAFTDKVKWPATRP